MHLTKSETYASPLKPAAQDRREPEAVARARDALAVVCADAFGWPSDPGTCRQIGDCIEMSARSFPSDFPSDDVESATDYEYVRLGDAKQYLLPVHSESLSCQRGTNDCSRNVIDFRNYRKYTGESTITFGDPKK